MYCIHEPCHGETNVIETRGSIRRRRCLTCRKTFLTEEVEYKSPARTKSPFTIKRDEYRNRA